MRNIYIISLFLILLYFTNEVSRDFIRTDFINFDERHYSYNVDTITRVLYLSSKGLKEFPDSIRKYINLKELYLKNNSITKIPHWIDELEQLEEIYLGHNKIRDFPQEFGNLKNLKKLDLKANQIDSIPKSFCGLESIIFINLSINSINWYPDCIGNLKELRILGMYPDGEWKLTLSQRKRLKRMLPNTILGSEFLEDMTDDPND